MATPLIEKCDVGVDDDLDCFLEQATQAPNVLLIENPQIDGVAAIDSSVIA